MMSKIASIFKADEGLTLKQKGEERVWKRGV